MGSEEAAALGREQQALRALVRGELAEADRLFGEAVEAWQEEGSVLELSCRWGRAEALAGLGRAAPAIDALLEVEAEAEARYRAIVPRVARSLRRLGVPREAADGAVRRGAAGLSPREAEVVGLVGQGLTSRAIARRLGTSARTVDSQIAMAMSKLGASTRHQAAVLLGAAHT
jgi:DNA-binding CsgD family transcriptional regulator